jgi:hypothetical protein
MSHDLLNELLSTKRPLERSNGSTPPMEPVRLVLPSASVTDAELAPATSPSRGDHFVGAWASSMALGTSSAAIAKKSFIGVPDEC